MDNKGFAGLIGLVLTVALISFVAYFLFKQYFGKPTGMDRTSILDSVKSTINKVEETQRAQLQQ